MCHRLNSGIVFDIKWHSIFLFTLCWRIVILQYQIVYEKMKNDDCVFFTVNIGVLPLIYFFIIIFRFIMYGFKFRDLIRP